VPSIVAEHISKTFRVTHREPGLRGALTSLVRPSRHDKLAVDDISFQIAPGEMVGYIGVNGAGTPCRPPLRFAGCNL
jgi:ABC-2 type transport system ATP-binding protein